MQTKLANMVDPQVMADMISAQLPDAIRFSPLARVDNTLVGRPGSTVTVPSFQYIGDATDVPEGTPIDINLLTTSTEDFTIKKAGIGVEITDEAVLSGLGDPIGEANKQIIMSIANKIDNDTLAALGTTIQSASGTAWNIDTISSAIDIFDDEDDESMVLILCPEDASTLRKAVGLDWERATELGDEIVVKGTYGAVLGAQVVRSRKLTKGTGYLVKQGALAIYMKRAVEVESARDIINKTTVITADEHFGAHLYDPSKAVKITVTPGP